MPIFAIRDELFFPPIEWSEPDGLLAVGGDLSAERLKIAYQNGIFPWFNRNPILWWSPDPRFVLFPAEAKVSRTMRQVLNRNVFEITYNQAFSEVIQHCRKIDRPGQDGTWITKDIVKGYTQLHKEGWAFSVEARQNGELVGGLYGVKVGRCFCGESMFSLVPNASKAAFLSYIPVLVAEGIELIDCQTHTEHLESLGARFIPRKVFVKYLT